MKEINLFGQEAAFDHVGIAVKNIDEHAAGNKIVDSLQHVAVAFITIHGFPVELIEPLDEKSPVLGFLKKGAGPYHVCFRVPYLTLALEQAKRNGFIIFSEPLPAQAFNQSRIAWVFSPTYGIIELLEKSR